jgi:hypothetical protein
MKGNISKYEPEIVEFFKSKDLNVKIINQDFNSFDSKGEQCSVMIEIIPEHNCNCPDCKKKNVFGQQIAGFSLITMPGCCGILISNNCWVIPKLRGQGIGQFLHKLRIKIAKEWGYGILMCTDVDINENQSHILNKYGWSQVQQFTNPRTENTVNIHTLNLQTI